MQLATVPPEIFVGFNSSLRQGEDSAVPSSIKTSPLYLQRMSTDRSRRIMPLFLERNTGFRPRTRPQKIIEFDKAEKGEQFTVCKTFTHDVEIEARNASSQTGIGNQSERMIR